ncbi:MAG: alpha/beta fold hydrolase [Planctomycetaceae bacterium]|nr:alpha/beta fold hydrolase [Planctomycetaceae bacterium]
MSDAETLPFRTRDGLTLRVRHLMPSGPSRGTILIIHGGCEHGGRYGHLMPLFLERGWSILLPDLRGHGLSEGVRTHVDHADHYLQDLQDVQREFCPTAQEKVFLGHSFGGLLAIRLAQTAGMPHALVLTAPLLGLLLPVPWWKRLIGRGLTWVAPQTRFRTHINPRNMTRDPAFLERRLADPLLLRSVTARWFFAMQDAMAAAHRQAQRLSCPILALQGLADRTVDPTAIGRFLEQTSSADRELMTFPEHVHEVLQESDWESTAQHILDWLDQRLPRAATPPGN